MSCFIYVFNSDPELQVLLLILLRLSFRFSILSFSFFSTGFSKIYKMKSVPSLGIYYFFPLNLSLKFISKSVKMLSFYREIGLFFLCFFLFFNIFYLGYNDYCFLMEICLFLLNKNNKNSFIYSYNNLSYRYCSFFNNEMLEHKFCYSINIII